jgi:accessory Sec system S-layer assembly protein
MFNFLKKRNKDSISKQGGDTTFHSEELGEGIEDNPESDKLIKTSLSFHPKAKIGNEEKYYFQFLHNELQDLKENQVSLSGIDLKSADNQVFIAAFVRNSLPKGIKFQDVTLLLLGPDSEKLGRKKFDLSLLGELPPNSSRPWEFVFNQEDLVTTELPQTGWKLAFELSKAKKPHSLELEESWEKSLSEVDKENLQKIVENVQPPKPGEVNFMGIQVKVNNEGQLHTTLLIRNGSDKDITLQQLPLIVEDADGDIIAKGGFQLDHLVIKANTSKPWTFIFPAELILKEEPDLSKWMAYPPQNH